MIETFKRFYKSLFNDNLNTMKIKLKEKEIYMKKPFNYNIYETNKIKKFFNFLLFYFFMNSKKKHYYIIQKNNEYEEFILKIDLIYDFYYNERMNFFNYNKNKKYYYDPMTLIKYITYNKMEHNYIYKIKISTKKFFSENVDNFINTHFKYKKDKQPIIEIINLLKKNNYYMYKNLICTKTIFTYNVYILLNEYIEKNYNNFSKYIFYQNYVFIYGNKKDIILNEGKKILNFLNESKIHYNKNKTHFIDPEKNNLIVRNFILTSKKILNVDYLKHDIKMFDEYSLMLIKKFIKKKIINPLKTHFLLPKFINRIKLNKTNESNIELVCDFIEPQKNFYIQHYKKSFIEIDFIKEERKKLIYKILNIIFLLLVLNHFIICIYTLKQR